MADIRKYVVTLELEFDIDCFSPDAWCWDDLINSDGESCEDKDKVKVKLLECKEIKPTYYVAYNSFETGNMVLSHPFDEKQFAEEFANQYDGKVIAL